MQNNMNVSPKKNKLHINMKYFPDKKNTLFHKKETFMIILWNKLAFLLGLFFCSTRIGKKCPVQKQTQKASVHKLPFWVRVQCISDYKGKNFFFATFFPTKNMKARGS